MVTEFGKRFFSQPRYRRLWLGAFLFVVCVSFLRLILDIQIRGDAFQRDFLVYFSSGQIFAQGGNPYESQRFVYPPLILPLFQMLSLFTLEHAKSFFLWSKTFALMALLVVWMRYFIPGKNRLPFIAFSLLAFYGTIHLDFRAGNISVFEQLILWLGFAALLRGKKILFCIAVIAVSAFKLTPIFFLLLLLVGKGEKGNTDLKYFMGAGFLFVSFLGLSYLCTPELFLSFLHASTSRMDEGGVTSPSSLAFFRDVLKLLAVPSSFATPTFLLFSCLILLGSIGMVRKLSSLKDSILISTITYALIMPRFKDYSYVLVLPAAYSALESTRNLSAYPFVFLLFCLFSTQVPILPWFNYVFVLFWEYYPWFLLFGAWLLWVRKSTQSTRTE